MSNDQKLEKLELYSYLLILLPSRLRAEVALTV